MKLLAYSCMFIGALMFANTSMAASCGGPAHTHKEVEAAALEVATNATEAVEAAATEAIKTAEEAVEAVKEKVAE